MKLSDIMSHADLTLWPEMGLVIFLAIFVGVTVYVMRRAPSTWAGAAALPLEHDTASHASNPAVKN